ncbi:MAG: thioredoxin domain-containing protein [Myxococcales bacterium]|nr:thioredoxin domain-containing protein [Myxococcales bacterium]
MSPRSRLRSPLGLLAALVVLLLFACRPAPSAELDLPAEGAEPLARGGGPTVIAEAPRAPDPGPQLDWRAVDDRLSAQIDGERYRIDYDADHPWMGATVPRVTIVVFSDYECPYCQRLDTTLMDLLRDHGDWLRVVWRQYPLPMHSHARMASVAALAANDQQAFASFHEWLFANARTLDRQQIEQQAFALALDPRSFSAALDNPALAARIDADIALAKQFDVTGTPTMFVNGRKLSGAQPAEAIEAMLLEERDLADRLIAAGSDPREVWARIMAAAATEPEPPPLVSTLTAASDPDQRFETKLAGIDKIGAKKPKVEILMCGDFDCPFSARSTATLAELRKRHKKEVAVFFRHDPLDMHKDARAAHRAAVAAGNQDKFWEMFELLYAEQKQRSPAELEDFAKQLGLDMKRFRKDIAAADTDARIDAQRDFCQKDLGANGTPTFFINGRKLMGAVPIESFEAIIAEELAATP